MADGPYNLPGGAAGPGESLSGPYAPGEAPNPEAARLLAAVQAARPALPTDTTAPSAAIAPENAGQNLTDIPGTSAAGPRTSWSSNVYHGILNALGGQYDTTYTATPTGVVQQQVAQTPGQQWKRIISGALAGFSGAAAAGTTGPGGTMRGLGGGIQAGMNLSAQVDKNRQDLANKQFDQEQQSAMNSANKSLIASKIARDAWDLSAAKKQSYEADLTNEANLMKIYEDAKDYGAIDLGIMPTFQAAIDKFNNDPTLHDKHVQGQIIPLAHVNAKGEIDGVHAIFVPKAWQDQKATSDTSISYLSGYDDKGNPQYQQMTVGKSTNATNGQVLDAKLSNASRLMDYHKAEVQNKNVESETAARNALSPAQVSNTWAEAEEHRAEASSKVAENANDPVLVDAIGTGQMTVDRMAYLLAKKPELFTQVMQKYPDFDSTKVQRYIEASKEFASTKPGSAGAALNNGATALKHLQRLQQLNTYASRIPGTDAYNAYQNQLDTVVGELAKFYGTSDIPGREGLKSSLGAFMNRDAAIRTQAQSMGEKFDSYEQSWLNAAPSAKYESAMPGVDDAAQQARAALDPNYAQRLAQERQSGVRQPPRAPGAPTGTTGTAGTAGTAALPDAARQRVIDAAGKPVTFANGQTWKYENGQMVQVQGAR